MCLAVFLNTYSQVFQFLYPVDPSPMCKYRLKRVTAGIGSCSYRDWDRVSTGGQLSREMRGRKEGEKEERGREGGREEEERKIEREERRERQRQNEGESKQGARQSTQERVCT